MRQRIAILASSVLMLLVACTFANSGLLPKAEYPDIDCDDITSRVNREEGVAFLLSSDGCEFQAYLEQPGTSFTIFNLWGYRVNIEVGLISDSIVGIGSFIQIDNPDNLPLTATIDETGSTMIFVTTWEFTAATQYLCSMDFPEWCYPATLEPTEGS